jgi:hypothetical protein
MPAAAPIVEGITGAGLGMSEEISAAPQKKELTEKLT